jgi:hypothetical protein
MRELSDAIQMRPAPVGQRHHRRLGLEVVTAMDTAGSWRSPSRFDPGIPDDRAVRPRSEPPAHMLSEGVGAGLFGFRSIILLSLR